MKSLILAAAFLTSLSATAFQDGEYICGTNTKGASEYTYKIKNLDLNGTALAYLEVMTTSAEGAHSIKGIATQFTNSAGMEVLVLGNVSLELKAVRPGCAQH